MKLNRKANKAYFAKIDRQSQILRRIGRAIILDGHGLLFPEISQPHVMQSNLLCLIKVFVDLFVLLARESAWQCLKSVRPFQLFGIFQSTTISLAMGLIYSYLFRKKFIVNNEVEGQVESRFEIRR